MTPIDERAETLSYHAELLAEFDASLYPGGRPANEPAAQGKNQSHGVAVWTEPAGAATSVRGENGMWLDVWTEVAFMVRAS